MRDRHNSIADENSHQEWVARTLFLASRLAAGRERCQTDKAYRDWLSSAGLTHIYPPMRDALIEMAQDLSLAKLVLEQSQLYSVLDARDQFRWRC